MIRRALNDILDFLYPPLCQQCDLPLCAVEKNGAAAQLLCPDCAPLIRAEEFIRVGEYQPGNGPLIFCERCGDFGSRLSADSEICSICAFFPLHADRVRSIARYTPEFERVLKAYKYRSRRALAGYFAELCTDALRGDLPTGQLFGDSTAQVIIPIPSGRRALSARGFNHMGMIALKTGRALGISTLLFSLRSRNNRGRQASLPPERRRKNMQGAFRVAGSGLVGKHVLLLDDLLTSGATVDEAALTLKQQGVRQVDVLTIGRSLHFRRNRVMSACLQNDFLNARFQKNNYRHRASASTGDDSIVE